MEFKISGVIDTSNTALTVDEFNDKFIDWIEENKWFFGGTVAVLKEEKEIKQTHKLFSDSINRKKIKIYTDGACAVATTQRGGWAAVILEDEKEIHIKGSKENTTNNEMEYMSVIEAFKAVKSGSALEIYSDSAVVINQIQGKWKINHSHLQILAEEANNLIIEKNLRITWIKVKGHSGDLLNEKVNELAQREARTWTLKKKTFL